MKAITMQPGVAKSAWLEEIGEPDRAEGAVLVEPIAVGACGTDRKLLNGEYGQPPPGRARLVIGHESLGRVVQAPHDSGLAPGTLVAGIVRQADRRFEPPIRVAGCDA